MARLPVPGGDDNSWGTVLNDFLSVEHVADGTLKIRSDGTLDSYAQDSAVAHLSGAETIGGTKTFTTSPLVPSPTSNTQAANKAYVDTTISSNAVTSIFTRSGAVTAQSGDYTFSQVGAAQGLVPTTVKTSSTYAASAGDLVLIDTSLATVAVTLPTGTPNDKARIIIKLIATVGSFNATIQTTSPDVFNVAGGQTQQVLSLTNQAIALQYAASTGVWYVLDNDLPLSQLDTRYAKVSGESFTTATAPKVVSLTDATTIAVDASLGNHFVVTLGGNRTLGAPTNPTNGQRILFEIIQDSTGARTLSFNATYAFGTGIPTPTLTTTANKRDFIGFVYNSSSALWYCLAFVNGF